MAFYQGKKRLKDFYSPNKTGKKLPQMTKPCIRWTSEIDLMSQCCYHSVRNCRNVKCKDVEHRNLLDKYIEDIIGASEDAAKEFIPYTRVNKKNANKASQRKVIAGWNDLVAPKKEEANFHYQLWLSANKPRVGDLYNNMCRSRNQFKYAKRQCINVEKEMKRDKFVEACVSGDKDVFKEIKKMRRRDNIVSSKMDGKANAEDIADHLRDLYSGIYNRTGSSEPLENLFKNVDEKVDNECLKDVDKVTPELIKKIVQEKIKSGKSDPFVFHSSKSE